MSKIVDLNTCVDLANERTQDVQRRCQISKILERCAEEDLGDAVIGIGCDLR
jgi:hypothetical protein